MLMMACSSGNKPAVPKETVDDTTLVSGKADETAVAELMEGVEGGGDEGESLNDIRFANFKESDWLDNDYIRALRTYLDEYNNGRVKDERLDSCKDKVKGKFVIWNAEPFLLGGLFLQFVFVDSPDDIFSSWVYSDVDEEAKRVTDYSVRSVMIEGEKSGLTKEQIWEIMEKDERIKLW